MTAPHAYHGYPCKLNTYEASQLRMFRTHIFILYYTKLYGRKSSSKCLFNIRTCIRICAYIHTYIMYMYVCTCMYVILHSLGGDGLRM